MTTRPRSHPLNARSSSRRDLQLELRGQLLALAIAAGALLGIAFVGEAIAGWATFERSEQPDEYDDEEDAQ